jgi:hypothetical protein
MLWIRVLSTLIFNHKDFQKLCTRRKELPRTMTIFYYEMIIWLLQKDSEDNKHCFPITELLFPWWIKRSIIFLLRRIHWIPPRHFVTLLCKLSETATCITAFRTVIYIIWREGGMCLKVDFTNQSILFHSSGKWTTEYPFIISLPSGRDKFFGLSFFLWFYILKKLLLGYS